MLGNFSGFVPDEQVVAAPWTGIMGEPHLRWVHERGSPRGPTQSPALRTPELPRALLQVSPSRSPASPGRSSCTSGGSLSPGTRCTLQSPGVLSAPTLARVLRGCPSGTGLVQIPALAPQTAWPQMA